ncbi:MAG TPA: hypothetical protein VFB79_21060 [Candidatus Angelobacter sp.]|nr:hypothetical protein [Candidatus Angelobacter sp.]
MEQSSGNLSTQVRQTLNDLAVIRRSLLAASEQPIKAPEQYLDLELAAELKSVVDELRRLLWAYVQALSVQSGRSPEEVLNWYKMELAVEMLRSIRPPRPASEGYISEFEQVVTRALAGLTDVVDNNQAQHTMAP